MEIPFLGKIGLKNQNCQFRLKFGTESNLNISNSMVMFIVSVLDWKYPFLENHFLVRQTKVAEAEI